MSRRFTIRALTDELQTLLVSRYPSIEVEAEVGQVQVPASGHAYLTLRDADAVLGAVCWRDTWRNLRFKPQIGAKVVARGKLGVYAGKGAYQLYVYDLAPAGEGALAAEIAKRRARLQEEGLLDPRRKRPLPRFPRHVGVATSLTGAALQDFLKVSRERFPAARVLVAGCAVQGPSAPPSVVQAVELLIEDGRAEVIVVTRGGGGKEDLLAFQDEGLARFLAHCPVPVVSAVGHQIDTTLADLVADVVAPTPTAAAVVVLPDGVALAQRADGAADALVAAMGRSVRLRRHALGGLQARLRHPAERLRLARGRAVELQARAQAAVARRLPARRRDVEALEARLRRAAEVRLARARERIVRLTTAAEALSPQRVLERGYAVVLGRDGVVASVGDVGYGDALEVVVHDGRFGATVTAGGAAPPEGR